MKVKCLLLPLLALLIPSAHATNYVECEAIRAVITRNNMQIEDAEKAAIDLFVEKKIGEKFGLGNTNIKDCSQVADEDTLLRSTCDAYAKRVYSNSKEEAKPFLEEYKKTFIDVELRATKDFKKRGCYYF